MYLSKDTDTDKSAQIKQTKVITVVPINVVNPGKISIYFTPTGGEGQRCKNSKTIIPQLKGNKESSRQSLGSAN